MVFTGCSLLFLNPDNLFLHIKEVITIKETIFPLLGHDVIPPSSVNISDILASTVFSMAVLCMIVVCLSMYQSFRAIVKLIIVGYTVRSLQIPFKPVLAESAELSIVLINVNLL